MKKTWIFIGISLVLIGILIFSYYKFFKVELIIKNNEKVEINSDVEIIDFIKQSKNVEILNLKNKIDTRKLGVKRITIEGKKIIGKIRKDLTYKVIDTEKPIISYTKELSTEENQEIDLLKDVKVNDNSNEEILANVEGEYDFKKSGIYNLLYKAKDSSGNEAKEKFILNVKEKKVKLETSKTTNIKKDSSSSNQTIATNQNPYYIKINRAQNVVVVYGLENGEYSKIVKVFICSTGKSTPIGTFSISNRYEWRALFGDVYGQYATRITGHILFHSAPYLKMSKDSLKYEEYNKLGTSASMGCIRLRVVDAKWIYDNCQKGTQVTIYDSESLDGIEKPILQLIDLNSENRNWDPTDPDTNNPW